MDYFEDDDRDYPSREKISKSNISKELEKKLEKTYQPDSSYDDEFKGKDITYITNNKGEVITFYIGKRNANGKINGEVFYRRIKKRDDQKILESHWDNQGKVKGM